MALDFRTHTVRDFTHEKPTDYVNEQKRKVDGYYVKYLSINQSTYLPTYLFTYLYISFYWVDIHKYWGLKDKTKITKDHFPLTSSFSNQAC